MKRIAVLGVAAGVGVGATALAQGGGGLTPYELPEPSVTSGQVLHMPSARRCLAGTRVTVRITPPPGAVLGLVRVRAAGREQVRLTGVPRAASATVRLRHGTGNVSVSGVTLGGQDLRMRRTYIGCRARRPPAARPAPAPAPERPVTGGGQS